MTKMSLANDKKVKIEEPECKKVKIEDEPEYKKVKIEESEDKIVKIEVSESEEESDNDEALDKLDELQDKLEKLNEESYEEVLKVQQKYNELRKPMYAERDEVIKAIPHFWPNVFLNHPAIFDLLRPEDHKVFKYFLSLEVEDFKDGKSGYCISFNFKINPYFENTKLSKAFITPENSASKVTGTTIKWKKGMDITDEDHQKKKGKKGAHFDGRPSFFCWFTVPEKGEIDELFNDEVAEAITEEIWPDPLKYCSFRNDEEDEDEFESGEGDSIDDDDDDDGEDDEE